MAGNNADDVVEELIAALSDADEGENKEYVIEAVLATRVAMRGSQPVVEYLIKWQGKQRLTQLLAVRLQLVASFRPLTGRLHLANTPESAGIVPRRER